MALRSVVPPAAAAAFLLFAALALAGVSIPRRHAWKIPAALSALFLIVSIRAVAAGGAFGFWTEHTRNEWGNQIWLDLLLAVGIGWFLVVPHARAVGMRLLPWLGFIACTGSIGFTAMIARLLYLRGVDRRPGTSGRGITVSPPGS